MAWLTVLQPISGAYADDSPYALGGHPSVVLLLVCALPVSLLVTEMFWRLMAGGAGDHLRAPSGDRHDTSGMGPSRSASPANPSLRSASLHTYWVLRRGRKAWGVRPKGTDPESLANRWPV